MANWLTRILPPSQTGRGIGSSSSMVPTKFRPQALVVKGANQKRNEQLPNATIVYGVAASALIVIALCFFMKSVWVTGFLVLLPAACFLGFALYFLKHAND